MSVAADGKRPIWRQPLFHFLLAGAAIFALDGLRDTPESATSNQIIVSVAQVQRIAGLWQKTWGRPPSESELQALVRDHIREEIYYREALKLGLDVNDTVIRRRLRQKMEFLTTDVAEITAPNDVVLQAYYQQNAERYRQTAVFDFMQVYYSHASSDRARQALDALRNGTIPDHFGESISLPRTMSRAEEAGIVRTFGSAFHDTLNTLETGVWSGPIVSGFGQHLVRISRKKPAHLPAFGDVRSTVEKDWQAEQSSVARDEFYEALRAGYEVEIEVPAE